MQSNSCGRISQGGANANLAVITVTCVESYSRNYRYRLIDNDEQLTRRGKILTRKTKKKTITGTEIDMVEAIAL